MPSFPLCMKFRWRWLLVCVVALVVAGAALLWLRARPDPHIEGLLDWKSGDCAIDEEVILAELPLLDDHAVQRLAEEAFRVDGIHVRALMSLRRWLPSWVQPRLAALGTARRFRAMRAVRVLGLLQDRARPFASRLATLATNRNSEISGDAILALAAINRVDPTNLTSISPWIGWSGQPSNLRLAALFALRMTNPPTSLLSVFMAGLDAPDDNSRLHSARAIARYGTTASNAAPLLRRHLADSSKMVRPDMAFALGFVAPEFADEAVAAMLDAERRGNDYAGDNAAQLYARLGPAARAAVPSLEVKLTVPSWKMFHGGAAVALWRIRHEVTPAIIEAMAWDIEHGVQRSQRWSLQALAEIGPPAANAVPALQRMTKHPRVLLRQLAEDALKSITKPTAAAH